MLSLTSLTAPLAARTAFSSIGVNCRQGPHHGAQKSTRTGTSREASTTSRMKSLVVVFLMRSVSAVAAPSERIGVSMLLLIHPGVRDPILGRRQGQAGRAPYFTGKMGRGCRFGNALGNGQERGRMSGS